MKKMILTIVTLCLLTGCNQTKTMQKYSDTFLGFDTYITLIGYTTSESEFNKYANQMEKEFTYYNQLFDKYNNYEGMNNLKTINDQAGISKVTVDETIIDLLLLAKEYTELTNGAFDVTMGNTMSIWHNYREKGQDLNMEGSEDAPIPSISELEESKKYSGWEYIEIDEENNTVYITDKNVSLDVGAIAKGYTTEKVAQSLIHAGLTSGAIDGGGNVRLLGPKPDGNQWKIGIGDPEDLSKSTSVVYTDGNMSIVTSGDYQRYFISNGIRYGHIIDPDTLYPATNCRSVSIVTKDSGIADILSTALFVMDINEALAFIESFNQTHTDNTIGAFWIYDLDNYPTSEYGKEYNGYYVIASENLQPQLKGYGISE